MTGFKGSLKKNQPRNSGWDENETVTGRKGKGNGEKGRRGDESEKGRRGDESEKGRRGDESEKGRRGEWKGNENDAMKSEREYHDVMEYALREHEGNDDPKCFGRKGPRGNDSVTTGDDSVTKGNDPVTTSMNNPVTTSMNNPVTTSMSNPVPGHNSSAPENESDDSSSDGSVEFTVTVGKKNL